MKGWPAIATGDSSSSCKHDSCSDPTLMLSARAPPEMSSAGNSWLMVSEPPPPETVMQTAHERGCCQHHAIQKLVSGTGVHHQGVITGTAIDGLGGGVSQADAVSTIATEELSALCGSNSRVNCVVAACTINVAAELVEPTKVIESAPSAKPPVPLPEWLYPWRRHE